MRKTDADINFKPWIYEIARNAAIDQYRRSSRTEEVSIDLDGGFASSEVARVPRPAGPDSSVIDKERFDHLRWALDELSDTHHRIIVMRELEGLSYREIGERMGLTPGAVESSLFRARRKLEHEYSQLDTGRRCQLMGALIGRLAEGLESDRDRRRLDRHARRCSHCRCRARRLGVEPMLRRTGIAARAAAFLPLPAFARRRFSGDGAQGAGTGAQQAAAPFSSVAAPTLEMGASMAGKAAAVIATVALVGGGGATLGGVGPLGVGGNGASVIEKQRGEPGGTTSRPRETPGRGTTSDGRGVRDKGGKAGQSGDRAPKAPADSSPAGDAGQDVPPVPSLPGLPTVPRSEPPPPPPPPDSGPPSAGSGPGVEAPAVPDARVTAPQPEPSAPAAPDMSAPAPDAVGTVTATLGSA